MNKQFIEQEDTMANKSIYERMVNVTINQIRAKLDNNEILLYISENSKNKKNTMNVGKDEKEKNLIYCC